MSILTLSSFNSLPYQVANEIINAIPTRFTAPASSKKSSTQKEEPKTRSLTCKCCKWQGKDTEAKTEVFFLENTTELELYCPRCNSYLGFHK